MPPVKRCLALVLACAGLVLAQGADADSTHSDRVQELGEFTDSPFPSASCPAPANAPDACVVVARVSGVTMQINGHGSPFKVKKAGNIVALTLQLSKPTTTEIDYFKTTFGGSKSDANTPFGDAPQVRVAILKSLHQKQRFQLMRQSDVYDVEDYLGSTYTFALKAPLRIHKQELVGLTVPTWLPALGRPLTTKNAWRSSFRDTECNAKNKPARQHQKVGTYKQYGCFFRTERPLYTATYVPDADKTK
jgi:hypothetical protein